MLDRSQACWISSEIRMLVGSGRFFAASEFAQALSILPPGATGGGWSAPPHEVMTSTARRAGTWAVDFMGRLLRDGFSAWGTPEQKCSVLHCQPRVASLAWLARLDAQVPYPARCRAWSKGGCAGHGRVESVRDGRLSEHGAHSARSVHGGRVGASRPRR